jgi:hypothetical protein
VTLALVRVDQDAAGRYVPICRYCGFAGRPRSAPGEARAILANHETCGRHRRALCRAACRDRASA